MADGISIDVLNNKAVLAKFKQLKTKQQKDALRKAATKATGEFRKAAKRSVPSRTGTLKRALGSSTKSFARGNVVYGLVGVKRKRSGKDSGEYDRKGVRVIPELYMNVLESGTVKGPRRTESGANRGEVKAGKYLHKAAKSSENQARSAFNQRFIQRIMSHWRANKVG